MRHVAPDPLLTDLQALAATAPADATLVIFHSAVLAYVRPPADRAMFAEAVRRLDACWISNEAAGVFPEVDKKVRGEIPADRFVLSVNADPVAFTGPHGQSIDWFA